MQTPLLLERSLFYELHGRVEDVWRAWIHHAELYSCYDWTRMKDYSRRGFTLIELLIVVSIIGLLAMISIIVLNGARLKQRDTKRISDVQIIRAALEQYWFRNASYPLVGPAALQAIGSGSYSAITSNGFEAIPPTGEIFLQRVPVGPKSGEFYQYRGDSTGYSLRFIPEGATVFGAGNGSTPYYAHSDVVDTADDLK
jgi:prepilin-type N-terminal cleavage/methylation domain-containing protein